MCLDCSDCLFIVYHDSVSFRTEEHLYDLTAVIDPLYCRLLV